MPGSPTPDASPFWLSGRQISGYSLFWPRAGELSTTVGSGKAMPPPTQPVECKFFKGLGDDLRAMSSLVASTQRRPLLGIHSA
jgi:hypothetical protein